MTKEPARIVTVDRLTGSATESHIHATIWNTTYRFSRWEQLPDDHPIYSAIGRVASEWAYYEHLLDDIIRMLVGLEGPIITSVTAQMMGVNNRLNAITALCTVKDISKNVQSKINKIRNNSHIPQENRNRIVHDPWFLNPITNEIAQFKSMPPKDLKYGVKPTEAAFIDETLKQIADRITEVKKLTDSIQLALYPLQEKPLEPPASTPNETAP